MTRPICKFHPDARQTEAYIFRPGAETIGGTLPVLSPRQLREDLDFQRRGGQVLHLTLSLPQGVRASNEQWLRIVSITLAEIGIAPDRTAWVCARHVDAGCDHCHIAVSLHDFTGREIEARLSRRATDLVHQRLNAMIGLDFPEYFDPEVPSLDPVTPKRNLNTAVKQKLHAALRAVFKKWQPATMEDLDERLSQPEFGFSRSVEINRHGVRSNVWWAPDDQCVIGGELGQAWEPKFLIRRLVYAGQLRALRKRIELVALWRAFAMMKSRLKETLDDITKRHEALGLAGAGTGVDGTAAEDGRQRAEAVPAPRAAGDTGGRDGGAGSPVDRPARPEPGRSGAAGRAAGGDRNGSEGNAALSGEAHCRSGGDEEGGDLDRERLEPSIPLTLGHVLGEVLAIARAEELKVHKWRLARGGSLLRVAWADLSVVQISPDRVEILRDGWGRDGERFREAFQRRFPERGPECVSGTPVAEIVSESGPVDIARDDPGEDVTPEP
ncbi:MAG: relaxase/mobilization nuclease domain-containing protein [Thioclava marina]|uniref:relaxase/mobilization nuclease domain-containing protein n=1 Tax=Thioclava marina TaxID=1915077 RepID=UPI001995BDB8|nr:relaxase/mobilization nuclease domain-containing protein [Thioclava marina]MBC7147003.1 relaxase/mobilization nuclease domain-containing protein [Thioclava marina]